MTKTAVQMPGLGISRPLSARMAVYYLCLLFCICSAQPHSHQSLCLFWLILHQLSYAKQFAQFLPQQLFYTSVFCPSLQLLRCYPVVLHQLFCTTVHIQTAVSHPFNFVLTACFLLGAFLVWQKSGREWVFSSQALKSGVLCWAFQVHNTRAVGWWKKLFNMKSLLDIEGNAASV